VYAATRTNGLLTLLVINKSASNSLNASLSIHGYLPNTNAVVYSYGIPQDDAACTGFGSADVIQTNFTGAATNFSWSFPPYSASVICLSNPPPPAVTRFARNADGTTTITWANQGGWIYLVQDCDSMGEPWQTIASQTNAGLTNLTFLYTHPLAASATQRFYRVGLVNP